jgi:hypothetical protein
VLAQTVDPAVSAAKFERELDQFRDLEAEYRTRGWFLLTAEFPEVEVLMVTAHLKPPVVVTGVRFDFTDYDLRPPSVKLINPFTGKPWTESELPTRLMRRTEVEGQPPPGVVLPPGIEMPNKMFQDQPLMQAYPNEEPFLCIAGVREYHEHPAHSGDAWELHRAEGAGRLVRLLEVIDTYGIRPWSGFNVRLEPQVIGLVQNDVPQ